MFHRPKNEDELQSEKKEGPDMSAQSNEAKSNENAGAGRSSIEIPGSNQKTGQNAPRIPGNYPGYASQPYNPAEATRSGSSDNGRKLIVGNGISMSGEIEACDHLIVEGKVEAALKGANMLEISESGTFFGTVEIEEATVAGRFEGDLTVNGRLTIKSGGSITGAISYGELAVEAGATLDGKLSPLNNKAGNTTSKKDEKPASQAQNVASKSATDSQSGSSGNELPFGGENKTVAAAE